MSVTVYCAYCGAEKKLPPSKVKRVNFCSKKCYHKWQKENAWVYGKKIKGSPIQSVNFPVKE